MPEGPEIFYLKELIKSKIKNQIFDEIISNTKSKVVLPNKSKVINCDSKGKILWIETSDYYVHLHMMISGWLVFDRPKICKYEFKFNNITIYMDDQRRFSKVKIIKSKKKHLEEIDELGLDFLNGEVSKNNFIDIISNSKKNISALLLNQYIFCGIGNYIRNEALYMAKIHPNKKANDIPSEKVDILYDKIIYVIFSNLCEMMENENLKIPKYIIKYIPKKIQVPYKYRVYNKMRDNKNNDIIREKIAGRWAYYVKNIQK
jgi:formamidopyrimidine-DNA glycosylase